jgi:hypothetical protein
MKKFHEDPRKEPERELLTASTRELSINGLTLLAPVLCFSLPVPLEIFCLPFTRAYLSVEIGGPRGTTS